jgi:hypothetical protein
MDCFMPSFKTTAIFRLDGELEIHCREDAFRAITEIIEQVDRDQTRIRGLTPAWQDRSMVPSEVVARNRTSPV